MMKSTIASKCSSIIGHFDGHGGVLERYRRHCSIRHFRGYSGKPLDAAMGQLLAPYHPSSRQANSKQNNDKKWTNFDGHFDVCGGALVQYHVHLLMENVQGFGRSHWTPPLVEYCGQ
jgi:hypothetical protein